MAFEGAISSLGASRGLDGSIDRVPDPPPSLWNKLAFLSAKCETENIEILSIFEVRFATHGLLFCLCMTLCILLWYDMCRSMAPTTKE